MSARARDPQPQEEEAALVILGERPEEVVKRLGDLTSVAGYALQPKPTVTIRDLYFDTPDGALAAQGLALRIREIDESTLITLKGPSRAMPGGTHERLEIEEPWSRSALERVIEEIRNWDVLVADSHRGHLRPPGAVLEALGLQVIQHRETRRVIRQVISGATVAAELAIDRVTYHLTVGESRIYEIEVEAKAAPNAARAVGEIIETLEREWPELDVWPYSKLATGRGLERVLASDAEGVLNDRQVLTPQGLDRIQAELDGREP